MENKETLSKRIEDTPLLRFKEFKDKWTKYSLNDIVKIYDGVHKTPNYKDNGIMFLSVEDIKTLESNKYISKEDFYHDFKIYPNKGDIFLTRIGSIGAVNIVKSTNKMAFYVSLALLKPINVDSYFLYSIMQSSAVQKELKRKTLITAIPQKINKNEIGMVAVNLPISLKEQQQIGRFFQHIDYLIALQEQKLTLLNKYKEGLYKAIFSNISVESKISLKDIIMPLKKTFHKSGDGKADGKYIFFTNTTSENFKYFDSYDYDEEVIIANTGGTANFKYYKGKFAAMSDCYIFKTSENTQYIYYWLDYTRNEIDRLGFRGNGIKHLDKRWFLSLTLELPSFTEQTKIVNLLNSFDSIIYKETQTLNQLQKMKSGLLQQMFI